MTEPDGTTRAFTTLFDWLDNPSADRGISYTQERGDWARVTYRDLAPKVSEVAGEITAAAGAGAVVPILMLPGPRFVATFFGVILAGATPAPLVTPVTFEDPNVYDTYLAHLLTTVQPRVVVAEAKFAKRVQAVAAPLQPTIVEVAEGFSATPRFHRATPVQDQDLALLQFSSGSSGKNRAVRVPVGSLEANTNAMAEWLDLSADRDAWATWLPVHHDMGLILGNVTPVMHGLDLWVMPPERFIKEPRMWLSCFGKLGATLTAAPSFGLGYVARKVRPTDLGGMDFAGWKALVCGAERVSAEVLAEFVKLVGPAGFDEQSILPAYGMAEATLGISGKRIGSPTKKIRVASSSLRMGQTVEVVSVEDSGNWYIGCGPRIDPGMTIEVVDEESALGAGVVGEIAVSGSSVAVGYYSNTIGSMSRFEGDKLYTGDAGFLYEGELFVIGRLGDSVKVRGKSVFAEDTDTSLHSVAGLGTHNAVSLLGFLEDQESIIALVEKPPGEWVAEVAEQLSAQYTSMRVVVIAADRGTLMRTTSGKPRRTTMWQHVLKRWDAKEVAFDSATVIEPSG